MCTNVYVNDSILTNLSNTKSGTISLKNRDFCPKSGTFLKNLAKMAKNGNIRGKMLHTRNHKNRDMPYFMRRERGTSRILAPKIGTVPPKSGRLESMFRMPHQKHIIRATPYHIDVEVHNVMLFVRLIFVVATDYERMYIKH